MELVTAASGVKVTGSAAKSVLDLAKELGVLTGQALATNLASSTSNWTLVSRAKPSAASTSPKAPMPAFAGGFVGLTLGGLLSLLLELLWARQQGKLKPQAMLIRTFEIHLAWKLQFGICVEHRVPGCSTVKADVKRVLFLAGDERDGPVPRPAVSQAS